MSLSASMNGRKHREARSVPIAAAQMLLFFCGALLKLTLVGELPEALSSFRRAMALVLLADAAFCLSTLALLLAPLSALLAGAGSAAQAELLFRGIWGEDSLFLLLVPLHFVLCGYACESGVQILRLLHTHSRGQVPAAAAWMALGTAVGCLLLR